MIILLTLMSGIFHTQAEQPLFDPTQPKYYAVKTEGKAQKHSGKRQNLTAIFMRKDTKNAIINNTFYMEGDVIGNKKIVSIESNRVTFKSAKGISRLYLTQPIKKQLNLK